MKIGSRELWYAVLPGAAFMRAIVLAGAGALLLTLLVAQIAIALESPLPMWASLILWLFVNRALLERWQPSHR